MLGSCVAYVSFELNTDTFQAFKSIFQQEIFALGVHRCSLEFKTVPSTTDLQAAIVWHDIQVTGRASHTSESAI